MLGGMLMLAYNRLSSKKSRAAVFIAWQPWTYAREACCSSQCKRNKVSCLPPSHTLPQLRTVLSKAISMP